MKPNQKNLVFLATCVIMSACAKPASPPTTDYKSPDNKSFELPATEKLSSTEKQEALQKLGLISEITPSLQQNHGPQFRQESMALTNEDRNKVVDRIKNDCRFDETNVQQQDTFKYTRTANDQFGRICPLKSNLSVSGTQKSGEKTASLSLTALFNYSWIDGPTTPHQVQDVSTTGWFNMNGTQDDGNNTFELKVKTSNHGTIKLTDDPEEHEFLVNAYIDLFMSSGENVKQPSFEMYIGMKSKGKWAIIKIVSGPDNHPTVYLNGEQIDDSSIGNIGPFVNSFTNQIPMVNLATNR